MASFLKPFFLGFYHAFKRTFTVKHPFEVLQISDRWRGRPILKLDRCIGCGVCVNYCPNKALELVDCEGSKFPKFDAGRCCFCGLCIEHCPRSALAMTTDYNMGAYTKEETIYPPDRFSQPPKPVEGPRVSLNVLDKKRGAAHTGQPSSA